MKRGGGTDFALPNVEKTQTPPDPTPIPIPEMISTSSKAPISAKSSTTTLEGFNEPSKYSYPESHYKAKKPEPSYETSSRYPYPRSYYSTTIPGLVKLLRRDRRHTSGSDPSMYEWIEAAYERSSISESGEIHGLGFDETSKSGRKLPTVKANPYTRPDTGDTNTLWETGSTIKKR